MYHIVKLADILPPEDSQQMQCHQRNVTTGHLKFEGDLSTVKTPDKKDYHNLKNEDNLKNKDDLKNEDKPKNEEDVILKTVHSPSLYDPICPCCSSKSKQNVFRQFDGGVVWRQKVWTLRFSLNPHPSPYRSLDISTQKVQNYKINFRKVQNHFPSEFGSIKNKKKCRLKDVLF